MTLTRVWTPSPNFSASRSRNQLLILHTAEGATTFRELGNYFSHPAVEVSSQVGIDDSYNQIGEYVKPGAKAWAAFAANDWGEHAELCGFARWTREEWLRHPNMLQNTKLWCIEEGARYGIPIVKLSGADIRLGKKGICGHKDVVDAGAGGAHWDPGPAFPWDIITSNITPLPSPPPTPPPVAIPVFTRTLRLISPMMYGDDVKIWQSKMASRGWWIAADGWYGPGSENVCRQFQQRKGLFIDGMVGPITWRTTWLAPSPDFP